MEDFDVRAVVLVGDTRAVLWDTLAHPGHMAAVEALVGALPVTVVYSHADWDHAWGTCGLDRVDEVVAHEFAAHRFRTDVPEELKRRRTAAPDEWADVVLVPPGRTFRTRLTLDLGGASLDLHPLPGHTPDCLVGFVPEWGVLLAGDTVETPLPVVNDGAAVAGWVARLRQWIATPGFDTVVPSHGRTGGLELLQETAAYLEGLGTNAPPPGEALTSFYDETHRRNVAAVRGKRSD
ncbi:MAG TPA: MBL fold metallo-hydrolase [Longimicrobiales bacterium]|nr:MBL fold metallo-hydrolase [Longimicrobiales bacterium]